MTATGCECCHRRSRESASPSFADVRCDSRRKLSDSSADQEDPETLSCLTVHPPRRRQLGCQLGGSSEPGRRSASPSPVDSELTPSPPPAGSNPAMEGVVRWQMAAAAAAAGSAPWDAGPAELRRWYAAEVSNLTAECDALQVCVLLSRSVARFLAWRPCNQCAGATAPGVL